MEIDSLSRPFLERNCGRLALAAAAPDTLACNTAAAQPPEVCRLGPNPVGESGCGRRQKPARRQPQAAPAYRLETQDGESTTRRPDAGRDPMR